MLQSHEGRLPGLCNDANVKAAIPVSQIDVNDVHAWIDSIKPTLGEIEGDLKDARRRVLAVKGPKTRKSKADDEEPVQSSEGSEVED